MTVSQTALGTAAGRALESRRPDGDRLFFDPFAMALLPPTYRAIVHLLGLPVLGRVLLALRERQIPGIMGNLLCRTRFIDDAFRDALAGGCEQVVILGAGLDSRAYRIPGADRIRVFELDHPATQAWKREQIARRRDVAPSHVTFVPVDFERQDLSDVLVGAGFRNDANTLVIWEGVTQYLAADAVDATFRHLSRLAAHGSRIVFTYVRGGVIDGSTKLDGTEKLLAEVKRRGEPFVFGIDPGELPQYLATRGLELIEDVGAEDYRIRYLKPTGRVMDLFEGERIAVAAVTH
jgi:methyltransferase (TIGR00027 family)